VTLDLLKCRSFGETTYRLKRPEVDNEGHTVIEHSVLVASLTHSARDGEKAEKARALQALRYTRRHLEVLSTGSLTRLKSNGRS